MVVCWFGWVGRSALVRRTAVIVAVLGVLAMLPAPADAEAAAGQYVALGDSYSSGVGTGRYDLDPRCQRGSLAYPYLWQSEHAAAGFEFLACGGAQIAAVHDQASGSVMLPQAELVTLTAGGNDAHFGPVLQTCSNPSVTDDQCYAEVEQGESVARSPKFHDDLVSLLTLIRQRAPDASVVVLGYPTLFEETPTCAAATIAPSLPRRIRINDGAHVLRSALKKAVGDSRKILGNRQLVQFVDVDRYFEDHRICSPDPWINGFITGAPGESFHPNPTGHARGYLPALTAATTKLDRTAA